MRSQSTKKNISAIELGFWPRLLGYGAIIAAFVFLMEWLEYRYLVRAFPIEILIGTVAVLFTGFGIWLGGKLTHRKAEAPKSEEGFQVNQKALDYLGISEREHEVLHLLAAGHSNQEIADRLFISTNTVKTHLSRLYEKLEVSRRARAVQKAKSLQLIP